MSNEQLGVSFKPVNHKLKDEEEKPMRDESQYGIPFKPVTETLGNAPVKPKRDDSQYGGAFRPVGATQGIPCPGCGCRHYTKTIESRAKGNQIKREKNCKHCRKVFTTFEALPEAKTSADKAI